VFPAIRSALQARERLLPYIYNTFRTAFTTGIGLIQPMYYQWPEIDNAYAMDATSNTQYMFGPDMIVAPIVAQADSSHAKDASYPFQSLATKSAWLPPGTWFDATTGAVVSSPAPSGTTVTRGYSLHEIPRWIRAGAVVPYLPLESFPTLVGVGRQQYSYLGFSITPGGGLTGSGSVYEDDGTTTAYLTDNAYVTTTAAYAYAADSSTLTVTITSVAANGSPYNGFPSTRAVQIRLPNGNPITLVTANGVAVPYVRFGAIAATGRVPPSNQHYFDFGPLGLGPVIDIVGASTASTLTIDIRFTPTAAAPLAGVWGIILKANEAKGNLDLDRTTPGSEQVGAAPLSVLASSGDALAFLAGTNATAFRSAALAVPDLLKAAAVDVATDKSVRTPHSLALLASVTGIQVAASSDGALAAAVPY